MSIHQDPIRHAAKLAKDLRAGLPIPLETALDASDALRHYGTVLAQAALLLDFVPHVPGSRLARNDVVAGGLELNADQVPELAEYLRVMKLRSTNREASEDVCVCGVTWEDHELAGCGQWELRQK